MASGTPPSLTTHIMPLHRTAQRLRSRPSAPSTAASLAPLTALFLGLTTAGNLHAQPAPAASAPPVFTVKEHEAQTGSRFKREVGRSGSIPLNRRYEQLTPEQQEMLKAQYESMGPNDEPPFPANGLMPLVNDLQEARKIIPLRGRLRLLATVNPQGRVTQVAVLESVHGDLDKYMAGRLMRTPFKAARCNGQPCTQDYLFDWELRISP